MCIAVYKPAGQKVPSKKIFSNCFSNNEDGAGFMFPLNGKVHYEKGFMSFNAFKRGLKEAIKKYGLNTKDIPMVFHFRITSQGGVKPELTHPFPIANNYDDMRKLIGDTDFACVHNGIISFASSYSTTIDHSDTMEFIKEIAYPLIYSNPNYYKNKTLVKLLTYLLDNNRFVIMDGKGHVELFGDWKVDNGVYYSNTTYSYKYVPFKSTKTITLGRPYSSISYNDPYDDPYEDDYGYGELITPQMEKEFLETDILACDCGEELIIEYIMSTDTCIAWCPNCGIYYRLTKKAEDHAWEKNLIIMSDDDYYKYANGGAY